MKRSYSGGDVKRYLGILKEHFDDKVAVVSEQFVDVRRDIAGVKSTLDSHTQILDSHTEKLNSHTGKLDSHTEMIGKIMTDIEILKGDMSEVKNDLKQKINRNEFVSLERRVRLLESKVK
ncbi:MAG: hypothetical protein UY03_C0039G0004 [Parcubacteria group bacterium GW2011_GWA2_47_64]|nr:MAG: hypothetical protein UY03_C0039G0004 [Parcubacteria group bacterium GW2011_GWA2_47_64]KKU96482.1 MAG: hypothetical protein UY29_C0011G0041 [Parcubacteria group bacterium GW2011_GWC2_48_17]